MFNMLTTALLTVAVGILPIVLPKGSEVTPAKVSLGKQLFFDKRLSVDNTVSCSTCHRPERGWTDNRRVSVGIAGRLGTRNSPTIVNAGQQISQFHDGRAIFLEGQALLPLTNRKEMGNNSLDDLTLKLNNTGYRQLFNEVFGKNVNVTDIAVAISAFERTIISDDAPIDRYMRGETWALTQKAKNGFNTFKNAGCIECHKPENNFRDDLFHNTGVATRFGEDEQGRFTISQKNSDFKAFKTPTLREISRTFPYTHAGRIRNLPEMVDFYNSGGSNDPNKDARIRQLGLTFDQKSDLIRFLEEGFLSPVSPFIMEPSLPK